MPDVTVVIPTLDRWELLSTGALPSVLRQHDVDFEVVVVDDGSSDGTAAGLESLEDDRVRVVRHAKPKGLAGARNAGIAAARGEWVAFLDDDDLWAPWKLRRQLDLAAEADATFIYSPALYVTNGDVELAPAIEPGELAPRLLAGEAIPAGGSNVIVQTEAIRRVGGFDEHITHLGDFDCWIRLDPICKSARCDEPLVAYVQHPTGMHLRNARLVAADVRRLNRKYSSQYEALGRQFDGEAFVLWVAYQHRAAGRWAQAATVFLTASWHYRSPRNLLRAIYLLPPVRAVARPFVRRIRDRRGGPAHDPVSDDARRSESNYAMPGWLEPYLSESA
jgi:glycosyltransferase involved in cell wall biosynthesis